ncbi:olfactory receptor 6N2-like [Bombina bombina]|uniref:olfactory receptor 6N2-like n=1 Tax=Bombina bombina TaxID=8345 RepID=UPI00235A6021|nr:olfactory receptor 6N2-like [Bombina bombina]
MDNKNQSLIINFIITGFSDINEFQVLLFALLSFAYFFTISGNLTVISLICMHHHLHVPLYSFVAILSFVEIWYTTVTIPKMLNSLMENKIISYAGCLMQIYFLHVLGITETYLLTAMAYDRYMAICNPLRYPTIMTIKCCLQLASCCWVLGFFGPITKIVLLNELSFCHSNKIEHIFCDFFPLINLSCTNASLNVTVDVTINSFLLFVAFFFIILSYVKIISDILKISTTQGRKKAFSTCGAHLTVVLLFFGSVAFTYIRLTKKRSISYDRVMAIVYTVLTPMCNPIIYSLRNREIKEVLKKTFFRRSKRLKSDTIP